jgi:hypothetical protein
MWGPRRLTTLWAFTARYRDSLAYKQTIVLRSYRPEVQGHRSIVVGGGSVLNSLPANTSSLYIIAVELRKCLLAM